MLGLKKALLIGINYDHSQCPLSGCVNDVEQIKKLLLTRGYAESNITLISDQKKSMVMPTRDKIIELVKNFIDSSKSKDQLYFHFSGHGGQVFDANGDELDRMDECIFGCDLQKITDDELREIMVNKLPKGVKLRCTFDCCHSGTVLDLPFVRSRLGVKKDNSKQTKADVVCVSACADFDTAADTSFNKLPQGALTHFYIDAIADPNVKTWEQLIQQIITKSRHYPQVVQLTFAERYAFINNIDI
jgi:hypothetical protein